MPGISGGRTCPPRCAAPGVFWYTSEITNSTYILNQFAGNFTNATSFCNDNGGHLVSYVSVEEQEEVEGYYKQMGYLLPTYHKHYYIGAKIKARPDWTWMDPLTAWNESSYKHWGTYTVDGSAEPNNKEPPEDCAVANYTESYGNVFGWADTRCENKFIFICRLIRAQRGSFLPLHAVD